MRKYGINNFEMHVLKTYEKWEDGCELEKYLIKQLQTLNPLGYNMTAGGDGGNTLAAWSEDDKRVLYEQQANSRRGKKRSEETKQKISKSHMGKTIPLEQRKRQSETAKYRKVAPPEEYWSKKGCEGFFKGKQHTDDSKKKMSNARKGKSYEDLYGVSKANHMKGKQRMNWTGENNPNYVAVSISEKLNAFSIIANDINITQKQVSDITNISEFKLREFLREIAIENLQVFKIQNKENFKQKFQEQVINFLSEGDDVSDFLGIQRWEPPIDARLAGNARGNFPYFIPKTDQARIQNLKLEFKEYNAKGVTWEKTEKLHGSSMTVYLNQGEEGVCSRNIDLKQETGNAFWDIAIRDRMHEKMKSIAGKEGWNFAIQGELCGPGINGNTLKLKQHEFFVFNIYDIDKQEYLLPGERYKVLEGGSFKHVPVVAKDIRLNQASIEDIIQDADGKSVIAADVAREGFVYKAMQERNCSFKVVSNRWLHLTGN